MPAGVRALSTKTADSTATIQVNRPSGTLTGDILIAFHTMDAGTLADMGAPAGWSLLASRSTSGLKTKVWWKTASAEPSSYTFTQFELTRSVCAVVAVSGGTGSPQVAHQGANGSFTTVPSPSITPAGVNDLELRWACGSTEAAQSWQVPSSYLERAELQSNVFTSACLATKQLTSGDPTGTKTFTCSPGLAESRQGFTVAVMSADDPGEGPQEPDGTPPSPDIHWRYIFCDLLTDQRIVDLELSDVSLDRRINEPGSFTASIDIPNLTTANKVAKVIPRYTVHATQPDQLTTGPGRTVVHALRNGIIWGTYVIWKATIQTQGRGGLRATLQGATLESYFNAVEIRSELVFEQQDQLDIARGLLAEAQAQTHANIGVTAQAGLSSVLRDRTYTAGETATFGQRLRELAQVDNGFEYMIHTGYIGSTRFREWRYGYPKLGNPAAAHVFRDTPHGGNIQGWSIELDALRGATSYRARGETVSDNLSGTSAPLMSAEHNATFHLAAGWPRLDKTIDYSSVKDVDTLEAYAARWAAERPGPVRVHQVTVRLDGDSLTPANLGDTARLIIINDWWPRENGAPTFNERWRIIGLSIQPTDRSDQETATLVFAEENDFDPSVS